MTVETATQAMARQMREIADLIERGAINQWKTEIIFGTVDQVNRYTGETRRSHTGEQLLHITLWAPHRLADEMNSPGPAALPVPEEFKMLNHEAGLDEQGLKK